MRAFLVLIMLFVAHRLLIQAYPPYRRYMYSVDHKMTWIAYILVAYMVINFIYAVFFRQ